MRRWTCERWRAAKAGRLIALCLLLVGSVALCGNGCPTTPPVNQPLPGRGTITIHPTPAGIQAPWVLERTDLRIDYWEGSGFDSLSQMHAGRYTITWGEVDGYVVDSTSDVAHVLYDDEYITFEGVYVRPYKSIIVDVEPDAAEAGWYVDGPSSHDTPGDGDYVIGEMPPGEYTIEWGDAIGYVTPPDSTATHTSVSDLTFLGVYVPE